MGKHRELAKELYTSRIWRTVVFAGAMLGTPAAEADTPKPTPTQPANPAPQKPTQAPAAGAPAVIAAPQKVDPLTQKTQALEAANTERGELLTKLSSGDVADIDKVKKELDAKNAQINKLVADIVSLRKPRPRTEKVARPVGRGFVLA